MVSIMRFRVAMRGSLSEDSVSLSTEGVVQKLPLSIFIFERILSMQESS
jgi:hypothetical protein